MQKGRYIEKGRREKRMRGGQLPSAHFLLMDKANSRRQCCRQIWIFFITRTHTLICWGWQRQKHIYFFFHSGLLLSFLLFFFHVNKVIWSLCLAFRQNVSWFLFSFHFYRLYWDYLKWKIDLIKKKKKCNDVHQKNNDYLCSVNKFHIQWIWMLWMNKHDCRKILRFLVFMTNTSISFQSSVGSITKPYLLFKYHIEYSC